MDSRELNSLLLERIPSIKEAFDDETLWQEGLETGSIVVFEDVFMPYVIYCVENNLSDEINKCFNFIEECVCSDDDYQKNVIEVAIIENIHSYDIADKLSQFLRQNSLKSYKES